MGEGRRRCARSYVSFACRSPEVGMICQLLEILISGAMVLLPGMFCGGMFCGRKTKRRRFVRGGEQVKVS